MCLGVPGITLEIEDHSKPTEPRKKKQLALLSMKYPETNSSHLKTGGWKTIVSFWEGLFSGAMLVSVGVPVV